MFWSPQWRSWFEHQSPAKLWTVLHVLPTDSLLEYSQKLSKLRYVTLSAPYDPNPPVKYSLYPLQFDMPSHTKSCLYNHYHCSQTCHWAPNHPQNIQKIHNIGIFKMCVHIQSCKQIGCAIIHHLLLTDVNAQFIDLYPSSHVILLSLIHCKSN